jgi:hypothetical protein
MHAIRAPFLGLLVAAALALGVNAYRARPASGPGAKTGPADFNSVARALKRIVTDAWEIEHIEMYPAEPSTPPPWPDDVSLGCGQSYGHDARVARMRAEIEVKRQELERIKRRIAFIEAHDIHAYHHHMTPEVAALARAQLEKLAADSGDGGE